MESLGVKEQVGVVIYRNKYRSVTITAFTYTDKIKSERKWSISLFLVSSLNYTYISNVSLSACVENKSNYQPQIIK